MYISNAIYILKIYLNEYLTFLVSPNCLYGYNGADGH